jgi:hypothetical protein
MADPALVEITRARVQRRAQELREATERSRMLVVACAASFISGGITLPLLWQLFAWLGGEISLAQTVWPDLRAGSPQGCRGVRRHFDDDQQRHS